MRDKKIEVEQIQHFVPLNALHHRQLKALLEDVELLFLFDGQSFLREIDSNFHYFLLHGSVKKLSDNEEKIVFAEGESARWPINFDKDKVLELVATQDTTLVKVNIDVLEKLLCWHQLALCLLSEMAVLPQYQDDFYWIKKLLRSRLFFKVPPLNILKILKQFNELQLKKDVLVIEQGEVGDCGYLLRQGAAVIERDGEVLAYLKAGDFFGEDALLQNQPRNATVRLLEDSTLLVLQKKDFFQLMIQPAVTLVSEPAALGLVEEGAEFIDVNTEHEYQKAGRKGAVHIPLNLIWLKSELLHKNKIYITYANGNERAKAAAHLLVEKGYQAYALQ